MIDAVTGSLVLFTILFFLNFFIKFLCLLWKLMIILCSCNSVNLKRKFGDWAVVTGSTDGIGKEYAKELAKRDINIVLISRSLAKLNETLHEIRTLNPIVHVKIIQADFSKGKDEFERIKQGLEGIPVGILVNNVGKLTECPLYLEEIPENDLWDMINLNISATTLMTRLIIGQMKERGKGAIVNVCSATSTVPTPLLSFYSSSKTFVRYFSDAIRVECSNCGITVQTLSPYYIATKMVSYNSMTQSHGIIVPDAATYAKSAIKTLGRLDSTAGYWLHDVFSFFVSFNPLWLLMKVSYVITSKERKIYLKKHKEINA